MKICAKETFSHQNFILLDWSSQSEAAPPPENNLCLLLQTVSMGISRPKVIKSYSQSYSPVPVPGNTELIAQKRAELLPEPEDQRGRRRLAGPELLGHFPLRGSRRVARHKGEQNLEDFRREVLAMYKETGAGSRA